MNWIIIFNRLFEIINTEGETYYSGAKFLDTVRSVNYSTLTYSQFIQLRQDENKSTSRRDYYNDILMEQTEEDRITIVNLILDDVQSNATVKANELRQIINPTQTVHTFQAEIPSNIWNSERLSEYLDRIDESINIRNYDNTLTLAYTCLEGFYKSFIREKIPTQIYLNEVTPMAVAIRNHIMTELNTNNIAYPELTVRLISTVTNAICNARNSFSDSHSGNRAEKWLAIYLRDNVNAIVRLILNFI